MLLNHFRKEQPRFYYYHCIINSCFSLVLFPSPAPELSKERIITTKIPI